MKDLAWLTEYTSARLGTQFATWELETVLAHLVTEGKLPAGTPLTEFYGPQDERVKLLLWSLDHDGVIHGETAEDPIFESPEE